MVYKQQWRNWFQVFLPFLMHGQLDYVTTDGQRSDNPDKAHHILLLVLLSRIVDLLCVRILLHASIIEAEKLLHDYHTLFHQCFPDRNGLLNQHVNDAHLIGTSIYN